MSILTEDIKNTRFFLTLVGVGGLIVCVLSLLVIIVTGVAVTQSVLVLLSTLFGIFGTVVSTAYNSYFKDRQTVEMETLKTV